MCNIFHIILAVITFVIIIKVLKKQENFTFYNKYFDKNYYTSPAFYKNRYRKYNNYLNYPRYCSNCSYLNQKKCKSCQNCGICYTNNGVGECIPGDKNGPYFREDCAYWDFNKNYNSLGYNYNYLDYPTVIPRWDLLQLSSPQISESQSSSA